VSSRPLILQIVAFVLPLVHAFNTNPGRSFSITRQRLTPTRCSLGQDVNPIDAKSRRDVLMVPPAVYAAMMSAAAWYSAPRAANGADEEGAELLKTLQEARSQLQPIPQFVKEQKWDSIRAVLITPPLSDLWTKGSRKKLLSRYAEAIGAADGDEMAALEAREDAISHFQYLDMAAYNNNFSPAKDDPAGSTKELVRSYFEMPLDELVLATKALDSLIQLGKEVL